MFPTRLPLAILASLAIMVLKYGRSGAWRQFGHGLTGWSAGVLNRRGPPTWLAA